MPDLHVRSIDASLLRAVNIAAAKAEKTQREWIIAALTRQTFLADQAEVKDATQIHGAASGANPVPTNPKPSATESAKCELHGTVMLDYGTAWCCPGPPAHKEMKRNAR